MDEVVAGINAARPERVFVTAKSGVGKTFLSRRLRGYEMLELDRVVANVGRDFGLRGPEAFKMYKNLLAAEVMAAFVESVHGFFEANAGQCVVVEGAIADADLLQRVFSGPYAAFMMVYLHPVDEDAFVARMMKRFKEEKETHTRSLAIWPQVTPQLEVAPDDAPELKEFMLRMARASMAKSAQRYNYFEESGLEMARVEV
ncbi:uncharacterized protein IUM83_00344 [Phytophthora cinnamomi]|uniref:uncharacterized protein n=1 Tax=Phytophthora cinnamomi TaxID=4785 RepID=UPI003559F6AD|nr:hypothetical protein IUM83_00344 [Phytophthora cinnamomi]